MSDNQNNSDNPQEQYFDEENDAEYCNEDGSFDEDDFDEEEFAAYIEQAAAKKAWLLRTVALITVGVFLGFTLITYWSSLQTPLSDLVIRTLQLEQDIDIQHLQEAVVQIQVVAPGSLVMAEQRSGTGFNINAEGLIVTNHHVIQDALNMIITFPDGSIHKAVKWFSNPELDLAVITLQADNLPVLPLNAERQPEPGDKIRVVGNPLGLNNIIAEGEVEQYLFIGDNAVRVFTISAPIYPGNSGSPVFDRNGQVVGVVFANMQIQDEGQERTVGLAISVSELLHRESWD